MATIATTVTGAPADGNTEITSIDVPVPSGAQSGDVVYMAIETWDAASPTFGFPSGFSQIGSTLVSGDGNQRLTIARKVLSGADTGNYTTSISPLHFCRGSAVLSRGIDNANPVHGTPQTFNISAATSYSTLTQSTSVTCDLIFFCTTDVTATHTPPTSFTEDQDVNYMHTCHWDNQAAGSVSASGGSQSASGQIQAMMIAAPLDTGGAAVVENPMYLRPGFMTGDAFPIFMDVPGHAGWSPTDTAYDTGAAGPQTYPSTLTAAVGFTGAQTHAIAKGVSAAVSFTGAQARAVMKGLTAATAGFTGALARRVTHALVATLSFTGALATAAVHLFTQALTATLAFTTAQAKAISDRESATVGFTGTQTRGAAKGITAAVSFTGSQVRRTGKALTAASVSFTGAQARRVAHGMTAAVSFTGSLATAAVHFFAQTFTATVGFTGALATQAVHVFTKALTATVGFTGSVARNTSRSITAGVGFTVGGLTRRIGKGQTATVGFTGGIGRRIGRGFSAAVGFVGNLLGQSSAVVVQRILLEAPTRAGGLTAPDAVRTLTPPAMVRTVTAPDAQRTLEAPTNRLTLEAPEVDDA